MRTLLVSLILAANTAAAADFDIKLETLLQHDDGQSLWFHPRAAAIPGAGKDGAPAVILTIQKHLMKSDYYSGLSYMRTDDLGKTWTQPVLPPELDWWTEDDGVQVSVCDVTPGWHAPSQRVLAIGIKVRYRDGEQIYDKPQSNAAAYAAYDPKTNAWTKWRLIDMPQADSKFYLTMPGCVQWLVEDDGTILLPFYFKGPVGEQYTASVMRCAFDGESLRYLEHGSELTVDVERGMVEPSLARIGGTYYVTIRNDQKGYVATSSDGLHFDTPRPWLFDDGSELGSYNTQQHWLVHGEQLYLCYTRKGADNDHVFRHRAPLFNAQVDRDTLRVVRATEKILMPNRGATFGNFGATAITPNESWVTDSEGLFGDARKYGADGKTYLARVIWKD